MTVHLWRVASDTPGWTAEDMSGKGAASKGARWNHPGERVTYAAASISLAAWETRAHFGRGAALPWNRLLVRIDVPDDVWAARELLAWPPIIGEEDNVMQNPAHPDSARIGAVKLRRFLYDRRV
ncbi:MAG TPA: RES family NAD+ phosphorylase [Rubrivivax sp.]|nr:RES family NAD+ phosphorylase [Rubrivivax sp.]